MNKNKELPLDNFEKKIFLSLKKLTKKIINPKNCYLNNEIEKIEILEKKIKDISNSKLSHIQKSTISFMIAKNMEHYHLLVSQDVHLLVNQF